MEIQRVTDAELGSVLSENKDVIIKFYADWCGSCRLISPKFKKLAESDSYSGIKFIEINAEENQKARQWAGVNNLPFFASAKEGKLFGGSNTSKIENVEEMLNNLMA